MEIYDVLKSIGIEDTNVLPDKTKRKLREYEKIYKSPIQKNKTTGEFHPATKQKLDDLAEDIVIEAKLFLKAKKQADDDTAAAAEAARKQKEDEDAAAAEAAAEEERRKKGIPPVSAGNKKGPLQDFLGF